MKLELKCKFKWTVNSNSAASDSYMDRLKCKLSCCELLCTCIGFMICSTSIVCNCCRFMLDIVWIVRWLVMLAMNYVGLVMEGSWLQLQIGVAVLSHFGRVLVLRCCWMVCVCHRFVEWLLYVFAMVWLSFRACAAFVAAGLYVIAGW